MAPDDSLKTLLALLAGRDSESPFDEAVCRDVLALADRTLSTLLLRDAPGLPDWLRAEVAARVDKWSQRRMRVIGTYGDASNALVRAGIDFVLIKGFTHEVDAQLDPSMRVQGDIDLLCLPQDVGEAQRALCEAGFVPHGGRELSDNHAVPLLKPHAWQWRGDYYDPDTPVPIEVHHSIWNSGRDRIEIPGLTDFWTRRTTVLAGDRRVPAFCPPDRLAIAALHLLRHVLRNHVRPSHAWELHRMLMARLKDDDFWDRWETLHSERMQDLEVIAFRFCTCWFGGELPAAAQKRWDAQPAAIHGWFAKYAFSPMSNLVVPNKDGLRLHLLLLPAWTDRALVLRQRLLPLRLPAKDEAANGSYLAHVLRRVRHHGLALARTARKGADPAANSNAPHTSD
ncbi:MAG: nucleotidyltransferase family protein [Acidobacteriota bacterium]